MARLEKLTLQGVRSFGPDHEDLQVIRFFTPLTLILGPNGCGKTTIIESLKVATCGEYPAGSRAGQLYVHDPKISGQVETRGQLRLQFRDARGESVQCIRSMSTTQKTKTLTFKTVDQTITRYPPNAQPQTISMRCADVDLEMCQALGVSKPILNHVIFCHQEDSAWPLDEGKKLKEKFDSIFDATKYNKCMDTIRDIRKKMCARQKLLEKDLQMHKVRKDELMEKRTTLGGYERQLAVSRDKVEAFKAKLEPINAKLEDIAVKETNLVRLNTEIVTKRTRLQGIRLDQRDLREAIEVEFKGSTDELKEAIRSFEAELQIKQRSLNKLEDHLQSLIRDENRALKSMNTEQVRLGQLQNEEEQNKARIDSRNLHLNRLATDLGVPAGGTQMTQLSETQVTSLLSQVHQKMADNDSELQMLRAQLESEEQGLQTTIDNLRSVKVKLDLDLGNKRVDQSNNKKEARKVKAEIDEVDESAGKLVRLEAKMERAKRELDEVTGAVDVEALRADIRDAQQKRNRLEERLEVVNKEVQTLQLRSSIQAELDIQREAKAAKDSEIRRLRNKHEDTLKHLLKTVPDQGVKFELQSCQDRLVRDIKDLQNRLQRKQNELTTLEANRKHQREQLRSLEEELRVKEETVFEVCKEVPFDDKVKNLAETIQDLQDQTGSVSSLEHIFRRFIRKLSQHDPACPLCHRAFADPDEVATLVDELTAKIREFPAKLLAGKEQLERLSREYDGLQRLKSTHDKISQLRDADIPKLRSALQGTDSKLAACRKESEEIQSSLLEPQLDEEMARGIHSDVVLLDQHQTEVRRLQREIERIESKLPAGAGSRSMQQALSEQEQLRIDVSTARRLAESTQAQLTSHTEHLQQLREQRNTLVEEQLRIQGRVGQRKQLEDRLQELQVHECLIIEEMERLQAETGPARTALEAAIRERDQAKLNNRETVDSVRRKLSEQQKRVDEIKSWHQSVEDYERRGMANKLAAARTSLAKLERDKDSIRLEKDEQAAKIDSIKNDLSTQQVRERELTDNLRLRQKMEEEKDLAADVAQLQERVGDLDPKALLAEKTRLKREEDAITQDRNVAVGRMSTLQETMAALRRELQKDVFKNAETNYRNVLIESTVEKTAAEDLGKYGQAIEWAMINFHQERMKTINGIIRELWRQIYRGNDIDYVEIKTDAEMTSTEKRRAYNYRVVQTKNGVEIDMRGRCSAGQKVLASLIIRMALAETFSANCGILTLDEPTTNLDRENIESLSLALADIVNTRMAQKNFQLVVITHDEDFLESLTRVESIRHYYRVGRNAQGKSVISKYAVGENRELRRDDDD